MTEGETSRFIRSSFGSIWSLELLLVLRARPNQSWSHDEVIAALRASEEVLARSTSDLRAAGLIATDSAGIRYAPASPEREEMVGVVADLYATRPAAVRRLIVGTSDAAARFADAFLFRKGD